MKVLVIDTQNTINALHTNVFYRKNYNCEFSNSIFDTTRKLSKDNFDLITLDLDNQNNIGDNYIRTIRKLNQDIPIIVISSIQNILEKIKFIEMGADDYIVKPIYDLEIITIGEKLKNKYYKIKTKKVIKNKVFYGIKFDFKNQTIKIDSNLIFLTKNEIEFLRILLNEEGMLISRKNIQSSLWRVLSKKETFKLETLISRLRKKILLYSGKNIIKSVKNGGYKLIKPEIVIKKVK